jgi:hypothetical protein
MHTKYKILIIALICVLCLFGYLYRNWSNKSDGDMDIRIEVCDTQRPYFYYQLTCKNDTISFFSPSRGHTKQAINPAKAKRLHELIKTLFSKEPFIYEANYDALYDYEEDYQFEYRTHSLKMYINGKPSVFIAGFAPSFLPKEYRPILDVIYRNTAFIGYISNSSLSDAIFDDCYFILN